MIAIRLLGGAKKAVGGRASLELERSSASVLEILRYLQDIAVEPRLLRRENLIIAINGADSSALSGKDPVAKSGDVVTIVTVVHGGSVQKVRKAIVVKGVAPISNTDPGQVIDEMREAHRGLSIQVMAADAVFGLEHVHRIGQMALESQSRKIMLAKKVETDLLLRMACTRQISEAIARAGLKKAKSACIVALSGDHGENRGFEKWVDREFEVDDSVLEQTMKKKIRLSKMLGISASCGKEYLLDCLVERAAILVN
ncbi:MAG TPA: KEOPS complex subunit Cgi121 [Nitrososphaera sp.]|jgi:tRNA threonylcarbamoyladenosine modification (KEOPS) complex Cgi121 subunit/molybdopterin converting factor small subunit